MKPGIAVAAAFIFIVLLLGETQVNALYGNKPVLPTQFGGKILKKTNYICMIPAPPPVFVVPVPFVYYEIGLPNPAKLYYLYAVSKTYRRHQRDKTALALGTIIPKADDAFRAACINKSGLPEADGVIRKIGTSCKEGKTKCE